MAQRKIDNMYLVTAPAGSGKTTTIRSWIKQQLVDYPKDQMLCITFTNRAADELQKEIESDLVWIGTIHVYLNELVKPYFKNPKIVDLYMESFGEQIKNYLDVENMPDKNKTDQDKKERRRKGIENYKKKKKIEEEEEVNLSVVRENLSEISYGETSNTRLLYGQLSHDDLINFSYDMIVKYPAIANKIRNRFRVIYVDEYQDSAAKVLMIFYKALLGTKTQLYLFGDKMQQIYSNYEGEFEKELGTFCREKKLATNYRSSKEIVSILNNIYNDEEFKQVPYEDGEKWKGDFKPRIILTKKPAQYVKEHKADDVLTLFLMNSTRFENVGALNLYNAYNKMEAYQFARGKNTAAEILQDASEENPDALFRMIFMIHELLTLFQEKRYGKVITMIKKNSGLFRGSKLNVIMHSEKKVLKDIIEALQQEYKSPVTIGEFVAYLVEREIITNEYFDSLNMEEMYVGVKDIKLEEFQKLFAYLAKPNISTQHGVKGESHDSVLFVAEDSKKNNPNVRMYEFLKLFSTVDVSLTSFEKFYYDYKRMVDEFKKSLGVDKIDETSIETVQSLVEQMKNKFSDDIYFKNLCEEECDLFLEKGSKERMKNCTEKNLRKVYGTLQAYRIFYVGCSRARRNLEVLVDENKLDVDIPLLAEKFEKIGFDVIHLEEVEKEEI